MTGPLHPHIRASAGPLGRVLLWAPGVLAAIYLVVLVASQAEVRASLASHADAASAPMVAELLSRAPAGSTVTLGDYTWLEALWLLVGTKWLPHHEFVWQLIPFGLWLLTAACAAAVVARVAGRWSALTTAALILCAGSVMRMTSWTLNMHGTVAPHVALIGLALMVACARPHLARGPVGWAGAVVLGLVTGVGATDPIVAPVALLPLVLSTGAVWWFRGALRPFLLALLTTAVALTFAAVLSGLAEGKNITWTLNPVEFLGGDALLDRVSLLFGALIALVTGDAFGQPVETDAIVAMGGGLIAVLTAIVVLRAAGRALHRDLWSASRDLAPGEGSAAHEAPVVGASEAGGTHESTDEVRRRESLWLTVVAFWALVAAINAVTFVLTSGAESQLTGRYLVPGWTAVCVLLPILAARSGRPWLGGLAATLICAAATFGFVKQPGPNDGPPESLASDVRKIAEAEGVTRGFGGFWTAMPVTWHSRFEVEVYPVWACGGYPESGTNCPFYEHQISSWYAPVPGPSMLLIDTSRPYPPLLDPRYGKPILTRHWGPYSLYVYDHDIAPELGPQPRTP